MEIDYAIEVIEQCTEDLIYDRDCINISQVMQRIPNYTHYRSALEVLGIDKVKNIVNDTLRNCVNIEDDQTEQIERFTYNGETIYRHHIGNGDYYYTNDDCGEDETIEVNEADLIKQ